MRKEVLNKLANLDESNYAHFLEPLKNCRICPWNCGVNRFSDKSGYCKSDTSFYISSICTHRGEEPPISGTHGICNVFFGHCNLQCVYCQNYQISDNSNPGAARKRSLKTILTKIIECLDQGCSGLGFVSPSHFIPQFKIIVRALHDLGLHPTIVFNTNAYDTVETLKSIETLVDVYLPDFKYSDAGLAWKYSGVKKYPEVAKKALLEMYRQKGSSLLSSEDGLAEKGIIIRHLVLPGFVDNSLEVLQYIAHEISTSVHISLMSQYYPTFQVNDLAPLNRTLRNEEYFRVVDEFYKLGFRNGFIQDLESYKNYNPDFEKNHPFES